MPAVAARPTGQDLVRFLLTRVDEDERELKRLARAGVQDGDDPVRSIARLRAEVAAKRKLIGTLQQLLVLRDQPFEKTVREQAVQMLRILAGPYETHAGYRPEWRRSGFE